MTAAYQLQMLLRSLLAEPNIPSISAHASSPVAAIRHWEARCLVAYLTDSLALEADPGGRILQDCSIRFLQEWDRHGQEKIVCMLAGIQSEALVRHQLHLQVDAGRSPQQLSLTLTDLSFFHRQAFKGKLQKKDGRYLVEG